MSTAAVSTKDLVFAYTTSDGKSKQVLHHVTVDIPRGARVVLVGPNGSSKSSFLKLVAGKHLPSSGAESVLALGFPAFHMTIGISGVTFIHNTMWQRTVAFVGSGISYEIDCAVRDMMQDLQLEFMHRRDELVKVLDINLDWKMNQISDGERRRVQIMLNLLRPFELLLADEITIDLDVLARRDLMVYLEKESTQRGATILYATHIFDGLDSFPTHLMLMHNGRITDFSTFSRGNQERTIYDIALQHMIKCRNEIHPAETPIEEPFGGAHGYVGGRLAMSENSTMLLSQRGSNRFDAYRS